MLAVAGGLAYREIQPLTPVGVPVLRYRAVGPSFPGSPLNPLRVTTPSFAKQLRYLLRRGYRLVTLSEALAGLRSSSFLRSKPLAITFDGGYKSFMSHVLPLFEEHDAATATLFVASRGLEGNNAFELGRGRSPEPTLVAADLAELSERGFEIGSLGHAGTNLSLLSEDALKADLAKSRELLAEACGQSVSLLAYPRDISVSHYEKTLVRAGFKAGFWVAPRGVIGKKQSRFRLPRYPIERKTSLIHIALAVSRRMA